MEPAHYIPIGAPNILANPTLGNPSAYGNCKVENCTYNDELLGVMGPAIRLAVKLSDKHVINMTCSVELLTRCSDYYKACSAHAFIENKKLTLEIDLSENNLDLEVKHLQSIANYINNGDFLDTNGWSLEELKNTYHIASYLGLKETVEDLSTQIQHKIDGANALNLLCFGIKHSSATIIGKALPIIVSNFWYAAEKKSESEQYMHIRKTLIIKAAEIHGKNGEILKVSGFKPFGIEHNPNNERYRNADGTFDFPLQYSIPSDILEMFPHAKEVVFDDTHANITTNEANEKVLERRPEDCPVIKYQRPEFITY